LNKGYALKRGPYRSYAIEEKQTVIKLYKNGKSYAFISRVLGIPQKNIVRWCKNGVYRKEGAGRKIGDSEMERFVIQWITESYTEGSLIKSKKIREKALEFSTKTEFKSSKGWMKNFIRRYGLNERYLII
jgi:transposase-like protein